MLKLAVTGWEPFNLLLCVGTKTLKNFTIRTISGDCDLFAGLFTSIKDCLAAAVSDRVPLHHADLRGLNLLNAELDGADLRHASFAGSNLSGANISEAIIDSANFSGTTLFGTVLCESSVRDCHFADALFGGTDISHSDISGATFSTLSAFDLRFQDARMMRDCRFINPCGTICPMSRPPVVVHGLVRPVVFFDRHMKIGGNVYETLALPEYRHHGIIQPLSMRLMLEKIASIRERQNGGITGKLANSA